MKNKESEEDTERGITLQQTPKACVIAMAMAGGEVAERYGEGRRTLKDNVRQTLFQCIT